MIHVGLSDYQSKNRAHITPQGQLATAPISYSTPVAREMSVVDTAYSFAIAKASRRIVITSLFLYANKGVGANDATVEIYETSSLESTTVDKSIIKVEMLKQTNLPLTGLNWVTNPGVFLNGKTDDATIFAVIGAYYISGNIDEDGLI